MELHYFSPTHTLIVAHLDKGETLGTLTEGTNYIKVDGTDPNYVELLKTDPQLESVTDPGEVRMPPPAEAPPVEPPAEATTEAPAQPAAHASQSHAATHAQKAAPPKK